MASCTQVNSLFQAYIDGELGNAEKGILEVHLHECKACQQELNAQRACTALMVQSLSDQRLMWGLRSRVLAHLPEMDPSIRHGSHPTDPQLARRKSGSQLPWTLLGVAAVLVICLAAVFYRETPAPLPDGRPVGMVTFSDGAGVLGRAASAQEYQHAALKSLVTEGASYETLDDGRLALALIGGSTVKVNHNSALNVRDNRRLTVEGGQTFFDVGRDRRHFFVNTPDGEILVFGTAFLVDTAKDQTTLTVTEGVVLVRNAVSKHAVTRGHQIVFKRNVPMSEPYAVDTAPLLAWADAIVPDPSAMALFMETLELNRPWGGALPAEPIYLINEDDLEGRSVEELIVSWVADGRTAGHCSYIIHVADSDGNLIMLDALDSGMFNDPAQTKIHLPLTDGPVTGIDALHIRLVPDYTSGEIQATDLRVEALVR